MVSERNQLPSKRVCVIGAGPSGLVAARELRREGHNPVVFEQNHDIGGQWLYTSNVKDEDPLGKDTTLKVHSSLYASLRLISPRETIGFTDFSFLVKKGRDVRRFTGHHELYLYLRDFCEWFGLREMVRFNTKVEYVGILECDEFGKELKWLVRSKEKKSEKVVEEVYDAVVVANGHYSQPRPPVIRGMETWKRKQIHSHVFTGLRRHFGVVVVVGNSLSCQDISMELVDVAKSIYLSAKSTQNITEGLSKAISKHENLHLRPQYCDRYGDHINFPHLEEWRKRLCYSAIKDADDNLETYRGSYYDVEELIQEAYQSLTQLGHLAFKLVLQEL